MKTVIITLMSALSLYAQTTASVVPVPNIAFYDSSTGVTLPCVGCSLYSYSAGTTTPRATYTNSGGGTPNTNPIVLDSSGYTPSGVWVGSACYKFKLTNLSGGTIWVQDNVCDSGQLARAALTAQVALYAGPTGSSLIGFETPASSTPRTVQTKLDELISINDYGADPTGVASSAAAFTAAFTQSNNVTAACGVYGLRGTLVTIPRGVNFTPPKCVSETATGNGGFLIVDPYRQNVSLNISRLAINWPSGADTTSIGVKITGVTFAQENIFDFTISNFYECALLTNAGGDITDNLFTHIETQDCKIAWHQLPVAPFGINQNTYLKMSNRINSGATCPAGLPVAGSKYLWIDAGSNNINTFLSPEWQGQCVEHAGFINANNNRFYNPRLEGAVANSFQFQAGTSLNKIYDPFTDTGIFPPSIEDLGQNGSLPTSTGNSPTISGVGFGTGATITGVGSAGRVVVGSAATGTVGAILFGTPFPQSSICFAQDIDVGTYLPTTSNQNQLNIFPALYAGNLLANHNIWFGCVGW